MILIKNLDRFSGSLAGNGSAVMIGNFDGCHLGHQQLARAVTGQAASLAAVSIAVTFSPRPESFFRGGHDQLLFSESQKTRALRELGLDYQICQTFDAKFAAMSHKCFYEHELQGRLRARALVVGDDFRFGQGRSGDAQFLRAMGEQDAFHLHIGQPAVHSGERISSTRVRHALHLRGDVVAAKQMLGRPYGVEGQIRRGDQLGRTLGVPTANLEDCEQLLPRFGIYAGYVWLPSREGELPSTLHLPKQVIPAVFSIGVRPTLSLEKPPTRVEAHLLQGEYGEDALYGLRAAYYFTHWLRGEIAFQSLASLKEQMAKDIAEAKSLLL